MRKVLALFVMSGILVAAAAAQVTPFSVSAGYFFGRNFQNNSGNSIHLSGLELAVQDNVISLPIFGSVILGASAVLGGAGSGVNGELYRGYLDYKTPVVPGNNFYALGGFNYNYATGSNFNKQSGFGTEFGIGFPIKIGPALGPSLAVEARYRFAQAASSGLSVGLNLSF
ncbi:MAG TPA: hypothetical protein VGL56_11745 [Fimbriimonadaceae bacterium]|jgi:hypothetical protein